MGCNSYTHPRNNLYSLFPSLGGCPLQKKNKIKRMFSKKCDKIKNTLNRRTKLAARLSTRNKKRAFFGLQELLQAQLNSDRASSHMCQEREREIHTHKHMCSACIHMLCPTHKQSKEKSVYDTKIIIIILISYY